jgi:hypothetical protein
VWSAAEERRVMKDIFSPVGKSPFDVFITPDLEFEHPYIKQYAAKMGTFQLLPENVEALEKITALNDQYLRQKQCKLSDCVKYGFLLTKENFRNNTTAQDGFFSSFTTFESCSCKNDHPPDESRYLCPVSHGGARYHAGHFALDGQGGQLSYGAAVFPDKHPLDADILVVFPYSS